MREKSDQENFNNQKKFPTIYRLSEVTDFNQLNSSANGINRTGHLGRH